MTKKNYTECSSDLLPVRDALDVISGKWKLLILISISSGNHRFTKIERSIPKITSKVLSKELKDLEENQLIKRTVYDETPVVIDYSITKYAKTLQPVIKALSGWGSNHRKKIMKK
ncbi:MAG: helix-turn-helix domain-containing protein [Chloroflexota bacterium]|nr:helix-turn-helix domain-containing protein [Chloroflexota bacterium]